MRCCPRSRLRRSSIDAPRSLNDPVGERCSSFNSRRNRRASGQSKLIVGVPPCPRGKAVKGMRMPPSGSLG